MIDSSGPSGVELRRESGLPVYLQLVDQLRYLIGAGRYGAGDYLPATRVLAGELQVNFNTVNRAYRQLQRDGLIRSTPGKGAVVVRTTRSPDGSRSPLGSVSTVASNEEVDAILLAALERSLAAGLGVDEVGRRVGVLLDVLSRRVPPRPTLSVDAGRRWRSELLANRLAALTSRAVSAASADGAEPAPEPASGGAEPRRALVLAQFGAWCPSPQRGFDAAAALPVHFARESVQRLLAVEAAGLCVCAADDAVGEWMLEAASALLAGPVALRRATVSAVDESTGRDGEFLAVEAGLPGGAVLAAAAADRVLEVHFSFPHTAATVVERLVDEAGRSPRA
jgi:DNA-binding transcriptional regulator YhcF (GntR family)